MGKERAYSAKPSITSGDQCRASLLGLALLLSMGAGEADGGKRGWWGQARPMGAVSHRPHARAVGQTPQKPPGQIPCQQQVRYFLLLYIDNILLTYTPQAAKEAEEIKTALATTYNITNLGTARQFRGINI